jgi:hypothetical protein
MTKAKPIEPLVLQIAEIQRDRVQAGEAPLGWKKIKAKVGVSDHMLGRAYKLLAPELKNPHPRNFVKKKTVGTTLSPAIAEAAQAMSDAVNKTLSNPVKVGDNARQVENQLLTKTILNAMAAGKLFLPDHSEAQLFWISGNQTWPFGAGVVEGGGSLG